VYSHGLFLYPEQNSALAARLASHGYIVVSIAHPGDSTDVRLQDGRVVATSFGGPVDDPRFAESWKALAGGANQVATREALAIYSNALPATRIGRSLAQWRDDTLFVARSLFDRSEPETLHNVLANADRNRLAFAGMSFGGATSATSCQRMQACRAVINLDGQNFDPDLFDRPVGRPLLLILSDWPRYGLLEGQPREADFSPNDLAYERWNEAGENGDIVRVRLQGIRHLGFTDLVALLDGPKREERVGEIDGDEALSTIGDVVLAFLDTYMRDGDAAGIDRAIKRHPALGRHVPERMRKWADAKDQE
jgi:predicted dienelactone hydrolase